MTVLISADCIVHGAGVSKDGSGEVRILINLEDRRGEWGGPKGFFAQVSHQNEILAVGLAALSANKYASALVSNTTDGSEIVGLVMQL